jgi:hypothetical protein
MAERSAPAATKHPASGAIEHPAFVIGTGRCGLSPLMDLIAYHRDFAWPSQYNDRFPRRLWLSRLSRLSDLSLLNSGLKFRLGRYIPHHTETFSLWDGIFAGFGRPTRDLAAGDVTGYVRQRFRHVVAEILRHQGKQRFIAEYSGWSRVEFMREIFPGAQFIHIVRDGRAVAHSLIHVDYWEGWRGVHQWRWGVPAAELMERLDRYDGSFLALAAIQWKMVIRNLLERTAGLPETDVKLVRYEDLVSDPLATARECARFLAVDPESPHFRKHVGTVPIVDANTRTLRIPSWRENLSSSQVRMLDELLADELEHFGYL